VSPALLILGAVLFACAPLVYAVRKIARHAAYAPEQRYEASELRDLERMIERTQPHGDLQRRRRRPG